MDLTDIKLFIKKKSKIDPQTICNRAIKLLNYKKKKLLIKPLNSFKPHNEAFLTDNE